MDACNFAKKGMVKYLVENFQRILKKSYLAGPMQKNLFGERYYQKCFPRISETEALVINETRLTLEKTVDN